VTLTFELNLASSYISHQMSRPETPRVIQSTVIVQPKCGDALRLGSNGRYGSFHLWLNVWVTGKTVWSLVNTCHTWAP